MLQYMMRTILSWQVLIWTDTLKLFSDRLRCSLVEVVVFGSPHSKDLENNLIEKLKKDKYVSLKLNSSN